MPSDQCGDGGRERVEVELSAQAHGHRNRVLGAVRLELVQEPQPLLGERQRVVGAVGGHGDGVGDLFPECRGEGLDRAVREQRDRPQIDAELVTQPGHDLDAQDGVAADREEVVVAADPGQAEHIRPDLAER